MMTNITWLLPGEIPMSMLAADLEGSDEALLPRCWPTLLVSELLSSFHNDVHPLCL